MGFSIRAWDLKQKKLLTLGEDFHYVSRKSVVHFTSESMMKGTSHIQDIIFLPCSFMPDRNQSLVYAGDILSKNEQIALVYYSMDYAAFRVKVYAGTRLESDLYLHEFKPDSQVSGLVFQKEYRSIWQKNKHLFRI